MTTSLLFVLACSVMKTRPVQEMSNTSAALKAAKEIQADVLAPVLYREANEWFQKAKSEYKLKNFETAEEYAIKARLYAEQAEFEVIKGGGSQQRGASSGSSSDDAMSAPPPPAPPDYQKPAPIPQEEYKAPDTSAVPSPDSTPNPSTDGTPPPNGAQRRRR